MTHDDETVERIARLIYDADALRLRLTWERLTPLTQGEYRRQARAALSAMPERELLREAMEALQVFARLGDDDVLQIIAAMLPPMTSFLVFSDKDGKEIAKIEVSDFRRARAAADKIRTAIGDKNEP